MKTELKLILAAACVVGALFAAPTFAAGKEKNSAKTTTTVYISGHGGKEIANRLNESHATMESQGWRFADLAIHTENSDTQGAWVTYVK